MFTVVVSAHGTSRKSGGQRVLRMEGGGGARHLRQAAERADAGELWTEHDLVFPTGVGTLMEPHSLNRHFSGIRTRAGYSHARLHDFRHTVVSLLQLKTPPRCPADRPARRP